MGRHRPDFTPRDPLAALVRALVSQQLSTKAADTIHKRVLQLMPSLSAQMFLMFCLHRPDVLPTGDLGIVKGMQGVLGMKRRPAVRTMERAAQAWQPYRTIACWYVWRSLE